MTAQLLDGRLVAQHRTAQLKTTIQQAIDQGREQPALAVIIVGDHAPSQIYVKRKIQQCQAVGIHSVLHQLDKDTTETDLLQLIATLNNDPSVHGILVQLPLPDHINKQSVIHHIDPKKDVDGFHPMNLGALAAGQPVLRPCTPLGIMHLLAHYQIPLKGLDAVIIGTSNIVGRPMALELLLAKCTVTSCHRATRDLEQKVKQADLLVVAAGHKDVIDSQCIKPGAIVVDVGIHREDDGRIRGDLDFEKAREIAAWITPVPGGVGPMTVCTLLENTVQAWSHLIIE